jgi:hypothetical protein
MRDYAAEAVFDIHYNNAPVIVATIFKAVSL